jgi:hypothetical protein
VREGTGPKSQKKGKIGVLLGMLIAEMEKNISLFPPLPENPLPSFL